MLSESGYRNLCDLQEPSTYEMLLILQKHKQSEPIKLQQDSFEENYSSEKHLLLASSRSHNFSVRSEVTNWEIAEFEVNETEVEEAVYIISDFSSDFGYDDEGIDLTYKLIRQSTQVSLKSLACKISLSAILYGHSTLWISSRRGMDENEAMICQIKKETARLFLTFGTVIDSKFNFFKRQELPVPLYTAVGQDSVLVELTLIDNGDAKVILYTQRVGHWKKLSCSYFIPTMDPSHVMVAGSGIKVTLKEISVCQVERNQDLDYRHCQDCCSLY